MARTRPRAATAGKTRPLSSETKSYFDITLSDDTVNARDSEPEATGKRTPGHRESGRKAPVRSKITSTIPDKHRSSLCAPACSCAAWRPVAAALAALLCFTLASLVPASAGTSPQRTGVGWWTCTHDAHADVASDMEVRDNFSTGNPLCIGSSGWADTFQVFQSSVDKSWGAYPNIWQGCELDGSLPQLCSHGYASPVQVDSIKSDVSSASWYIPPYRYENQYLL